MKDEQESVTRAPLSVVNGTKMLVIFLGDHPLGSNTLIECPPGKAPADVVEIPTEPRKGPDVPTLRYTRRAAVDLPPNRSGVQGRVLVYATREWWRAHTAAQVGDAITEAVARKYPLRVEVPSERRVVILGPGGQRLSREAPLGPVPANGPTSTAEEARCGVQEAARDAQAVDSPSDPEKSQDEPS